MLSCSWWCYHKVKCEYRPHLRVNYVHKLFTRMCFSHFHSLRSSDKTSAVLFPFSADSESKQFARSTFGFVKFPTAQHCARISMDSGSPSVAHSSRSDSVFSFSSPLSISLIAAPLFLSMSTPGCGSATSVLVFVSMVCYPLVCDVICIWIRNNWEKTIKKTITQTNKKSLWLFQNSRIGFVGFSFSWSCKAQITKQHIIDIAFLSLKWLLFHTLYSKNTMSFAGLFLTLCFSSSFHDGHWPLKRFDVFLRTLNMNTCRQWMLINEQIITILCIFTGCRSRCICFGKNTWSHLCLIESSCWPRSCCSWLHWLTRMITMAEIPNVYGIYLHIVYSCWVWMNMNSVFVKLWHIHLSVPLYFCVLWSLCQCSQTKLL